MMKRGTIWVLLFTFVHFTWAQEGVAFQHLRNATFQSTNYNPAWMPEGVIFLGLPAMSGVSFYINNQLSYNDLFTDTESGGKLLDIDNAIGELAIRNVSSLHSNIGLFHIGVKAPTGHSVILFANERVETDFTYPENLIRWAWEGNGTFIAREVNLSSLGLTSNYFREYGIAYGLHNESLGLKVGIRAKMYQGIVNISTPANLSAKVLTENENFQINLENKNVTLRTAGVESIQNGADPIGYLIANSSRGFGLDVGFEKKLNRYYTFALGVTDIGFISWKEGLKNYSLADTTLRYTGFELKGIKDIDEKVDSIRNKFTIDDDVSAYKTLAVSRINGNFIYTPLPYLDVITTLSARMIQWQPKVGVGVGLRAHFGPKFILSGSVTRLPQQWMNIGAGLAATAGPVQFYAAVDKVLGYSVPNMQWAQGQVGINFVFGNKTRFKQERIKQKSNSVEERIITESKGVTSGTFMGSKINVKRSEGLYTIIPKQEKNEAKTITPVVVNGDHKKNLPGSASGQNKSVVKHQGVRTATGSVYKNEYKPKKIGSASGNRHKSFKKKKKKIRSVSGGAQRQHKPAKVKKKNPALGTGRNG
jgi:hypothetical protein